MKCVRMNHHTQTRRKCGNQMEQQAAAGEGEGGGGAVVVAAAAMVNGRKDSICNIADTSKCLATRID